MVVSECRRVYQGAHMARSWCGRRTSAGNRNAEAHLTPGPRDAGHRRSVRFELGRCEQSPWLLGLGVAESSHGAFWEPKIQCSCLS
jgi:hypothetical protein